MTKERGHECGEVGGLHVQKLGRLMGMGIPPYADTHGRGCMGLGAYGRMGLGVEVDRVINSYARRQHVGRAHVLAYVNCVR